MSRVAARSTGAGALVLSSVLVGMTVAAVPAAQAAGSREPLTRTERVVAGVPILGGAHGGRDRRAVSYITFTGRQVVDTGPAGSSIGDLTFTNGSVALRRTGPAVGDFFTRIQVLVPDTGSGREQRDTLLNVTLADGTLMARAIQNDPTAAPPDRDTDMVLVGGTGAYEGARGVVTLHPVSRGFYRLDWHFAAEGTSARAHVESITVNRRHAATFARDFTDPPSTYSVIGLQEELSGHGKAGRRGSGTCGATASSRSGIGRPIANTWVCQYRLKGGSILVASMRQSAAGTLPETHFVDAIVGGTGRYFGATGVDVVDELSSDRAVVEFRVTIPRRGKPAKASFDGWRERSYESAVKFVDEAGVTMAAVQSGGEQFADSSSAEPLGISPSVYTVFDNPTACRVVGEYVFTLPGGSIFAIGAQEQASGCADATTHDVVVTGGTGSYAKVRGTITLDETSFFEGAVRFSLRT